MKFAFTFENQYNRNIGMVYFLIGLQIILLLFELAGLLYLITILASAIHSQIYGAPYVPMKKSLIKPILSFADLKPVDVMYDLGSGDGRVLIEGVQNFGLQKAYGYDVGDWPYYKSKFLIRRAGFDQFIDVKKKNALKADISNATFIYMYLFPGLVDKLAAKIAVECQPGTRVLCPSFPIKLEKHPEFRLLKQEKIDKITAYLYERV